MLAGGVHALYDLAVVAADLAAAEDTRRFSSDEVFSRVRERIDGHRKV